LEAAVRHAGPRLSELLLRSVEGDLNSRRIGHQSLRALGENGKAIAARSLLDRLNHERNEFFLDEAIYSLGRLEPARPESRRLVATALLDVAERDGRISPVAHALSILQS